MADVFYYLLLFLGSFWALAAVSAESIASLEDELHPASDFSRHTLIRPRVYHGREKRQISNTREQDGSHTEHLSLTYDVGDQKYILDLQLNRDLISKNYFKRFQKNGKKVVHKPNEGDVELCHYRGKVRGLVNSWVAISTCNGLTGVIFDGKEMHYLQRGSSEGTLEDVHFLYKHSDLAENNKTCGFDDNHSSPMSFNYANHQLNNRFLRHKRSTEIKGPYNANRQSRYVELVLVVDNAEYKEMKENMLRVEHHVKDIANIINALYAPLNIFIALVGIVIWTERDEVNFSTNGDTTLTNFLHYRREQLIKEHPNDNAQLLTKYTFEHGVVGKALKGPICTIEYSGGVNTDHSPIVGLVAITVAHEMGHNFGMEHDTNECHCPEERCIMAPSSSSTPPSHWSSCSLEYLALAFEHGMDYCLRNKPEALFDSPACGNGFVEPGEQCDCGLPDRCNNPCCNATTCTLYSNATCATGECCDLTQCQPKVAGTMCRTADFECDLPEYCTGESEYCPNDVYKMDTEACDEGKAYCYKGFCRTRSDQCKLLWGATGKSSDDECYALNVKGTRHGNCGYNKLNQSYYKCQDEDVLCGMLHCKHLNERLEFGMESVAILSQSFINIKGTIVPCRTALVDLGINQIDPGLSPDGAKCGDSKMCVNQRCFSVESLRANGHDCRNNCSGNGFCNSLGHCHCNDRYAPPYCTEPGFGGSVDSGPTRDPNAESDFAKALFIIFLGIIPSIAILGFLYYYTRHNIRFDCFKLTGLSKSSPSKPRGTAYQPALITSSKPVEDNHSLLQGNENAADIGFKREFFGNFHGFSITPIKPKEPEICRPAPSPPVSAAPTAAKITPSVARANSNATIVSPVKAIFNKPIVRTHNFQASCDEAETVTPPALPPLNPGAHPRPIISSPILENSTCTAKELISPLKNAAAAAAAAGDKVPLRPAPVVPVHVTEDFKRPLSTPNSITANIKPIAVVEDKKQTKENNSSGTLNRIASFLKQDKKFPHFGSSSNSANQPKNAKVLDKDSLRCIEISNPIPQTEITLPPTAISVVDPEVEKKNVIMRAQSMRGPQVTKRPNIPTFGSMRNPHGVKRPVSIPAANRPKSPPPPRPPSIVAPTVKVPSLKGFKAPSSSAVLKGDGNQYDDCLNEAVLTKINEEDKVSSPICDNIYAVIDENFAETVVSPEKVKEHLNGSSESVNLLGEIVSEIQNRNVNSIYSTSTLARKKKEEEERNNKNSVVGKQEELKKDDQEEGSRDGDLSELYVNTSSMYKVPESIYSNMNNTKSSASSTSSGYINPSMVNVPLNIKPPITNSKPDSNTSVNKPTTLSTFKSDKKPETKTASTAKPAKSAATTSKPLNRQITPPNLRNRKASPTRTAPTAPKSITPKVPLVSKTSSNSPDLVTSCSTGNATAELTNASKSPDVLNSGTKKPNQPKSVPKTTKTITGAVKGEKPPVMAKSVAATNASAKVNRQNSSVAALQKKFENKLPVNAKAVPTRNA